VIVGCLLGALPFCISQSPTRKAKVTGAPSRLPSGSFRPIADTTSLAISRRILSARCLKTFSDCVLKVGIVGVEILT